MNFTLWLLLSGCVVVATVGAAIMIRTYRQPKTKSRLLQLRFRHYCRSKLATRTEITVSSYSLFFERMKQAAPKPLSVDDFIDRDSRGIPLQPLFIQWSIHRYGKHPFRRYYLVAVRVKGDIKEQELTYTIYEHRFAGLFALRHNPEWRTREFTIPVSAFAMLPDDMIHHWRRHIDRGWGSTATREDAAQVLTVFAEHLNF